jgi:hypothetical protein
MPSLIERMTGLVRGRGWSGVKPVEAPIHVGGERGPLVGRAAGEPVPDTSPNVDEAEKADRPEVISQILSEARRGRTTRVMDLCQSSRLRDSRLGAVARTRVLAIMSRAWTLTPPPGYEEDETALLNVERCTRIFNEVRGLASIIGHLGYGPIDGHAVAEHQWSTNARGEWVSNPDLPNARRFVWGPDGIAKYDPGVDKYEGAPLNQWPGKFVVHAPAGGSSDEPWNRGAIRSRLQGSAIKRLGVRFWLKMIERWGQPQLVGYYPANGASAKNDLLAALRAIGSDWRMVAPEGTRVEALNVALANDLHEKWCAYQDKEHAIALLGQNLTTEVTGGSFAAAGVHERMLFQLLVADLFELSETLTDQWVRLLVQYNWPGTPVPVWTFSPTESAPWTVAEWQAGLCTEDEYRGMKGVEPAADGKGDRRYDGPEVLGVGTAAPMLAPAKATAVDAPVAAAETVADTALNGAQIGSLSELLAAVGEKTLAPDAALLMITNAFPTISAADAKTMVDAQSTLAPPPAGADPAAPFTARSRGLKRTHLRP